MHGGRINDVNGKNWILGCLKCTIMFVDMQCYLPKDLRIGLLRRAYQKHGGLR